MSRGPGPSASEVAFENSTPILRVGSLSESLAHYVGMLGEDSKSRGAKIRHPPTNYSWALEMQVEDPDGHVLRFGSEPKSDRPLGEWFDMRGDRWAKAPGGGWTRVEGK